MRNVGSLFLFLAVVSAFCRAQEQEFKLPSYVKVCYRDDPKVSDCLKKNIENFLVKFKSGSKDFDLASLDPLKFTDLNFSYKSLIVGGDVEVPKINIYGLSKSKVVDVRPRTKIPGKFILDFDTEIPLMNLQTNYNISGNLFTAPIQFNGFLDIILDRPLMTYHITGDVKTRGDYDFLELTKFEWRFREEGMKNAYLKNDDVVQNRPALSRALASALSNNWQILKNQLLPVVFPTSDILMKDMFTEFFAKYPYDVLFPRRTRL